MHRRMFMASAAALIVPGIGDEATAGEAHRLALQVSDADPAKMSSVLNIAANVSRFYGAKAEEIDIVVVAFDGGVAMLRDDVSPVGERVRRFIKSMPNVTFKACGNTLDTLAAKEGRRPPLIAGITVVPAGVAELIDLAEHGWTVVRP